MPRAGVVALLAVLAGGALLWGVPWLVRDRDTPAAVPSPAALFSTALVRVNGGQSACARDVAVDRRARSAQFTVATYGQTKGPPLTFAMAGPGYRVAARVPAGYPDNSPLSVPVPAPPRAVLVRACVRNDGRRPIALFASSDRTVSRSRVAVDGKLQDASYWLRFAEARGHSVLQRAPATMQRITVFRPGIVGRGALWVLLALVVVGIPLGVLWAWRWALGHPAPSSQD